MKKLLLGLLGLAATMSATAETREIVSPNGGLKVCVSDDGGKAAYSVSLNGATCIETCHSALCSTLPTIPLA